MKKVTEDVHAEIVRLYLSGLGTVLISKSLGLGTNTVRRHLISPINHIRPSTRYSSNHDYFAEIATPEQSYWLGFISADGSIAKDGVLQIQLQLGDLDHLQRFLKAIDSNNRIYICNHAYHYRGTSSPLQSAKIQIYSRKICDDLLRCGVSRLKSKGLSWPSWLSDELLASYVLGYFDGNGCLLFRKDRPGIGCQITGPPTFIVDMQHHFVRCFGLGYTKLKTPPNTAKVVDLQYYGTRQVVNIFNHLLSNRTVCLPRKLARLVAFLSENPHIAKKHEAEFALFKEVFSQFSQ